MSLKSKQRLKKNLKLTSHSIFHPLWSADLSKCFSQLTVSIFFFSISFFNRFCLVGKCGFTQHCLYRYSLTLNATRISQFAKRITNCVTFATIHSRNACGNFVPITIDQEIRLLELLP